MSRDTAGVRAFIDMIAAMMRMRLRHLYLAMRAKARWEWYPNPEGASRTMRLVGRAAFEQNKRPGASSI
jgi:hypothetical protein